MLSSYDALKVDGGDVVVDTLGTGFKSSIMSKGMSVSGTLSIESFELNLAGSSVTFAGKLTTAGQFKLSTKLSGQSMTLGAVPTPNAHVVKKGITIKSGGLLITNGGLTINKITMSSGVLSVQGSMTADDIRVTTNVFLGNGLVIAGTSKVYAKSYIALSDGALKRRIHPISTPLKKVHGLRGVYFNWRNDAESEAAAAAGAQSGDAQQVGLIAQDVQQVLPEAVNPLGNTSYLSVAYENVIPLMIEAVRYIDRNTRSMKFKRDLELLEGDIADLGARFRRHAEEVAELQALHRELDEWEAENADLIARLDAEGFDPYADMDPDLLASSIIDYEPPDFSSDFGT
jgi:cytoskeletal protein CcmA (bactofilin family)